MDAQTTGFYFICCGGTVGTSAGTGRAAVMAMLLLRPYARIGEAGTDVWAPADSRYPYPCPIGVYAADASILNAREQRRGSLRATGGNRASLDRKRGDPAQHVLFFFFLFFCFLLFLFVNFNLLN
jgi:hypothetical protein